MLAGNYRLRAKLVDLVRNRITGFSGICWDTDNSKDVLLASGDWYYDVELTGDILLLATSVEASTEFWTHYQLWSTLSTEDATHTQYPPEVYYFGDQMALDPGWVGAALNGAGAGSFNYTEFFVADNREDNDGDGSSTADIMPMTDAYLAGSGNPHDWTMDEYLSWDVTGLTDATTLENPVAGTMSQGLFMAVLDRESTGAELVWSDLRAFRPENIPLGNYYGLDYKDVSNCQFVDAGGYTLLFGDGPVYRIHRNILLDVERPMAGYVPISRTASCRVGNMAFVVCEDGCYLFDGPSGTPLAVPAMDRVIRDRWTSGTLRQGISVAFDSITNAVYVLCPAAAELLVYWVKHNRISMFSGAYFAWAREMAVMDGNGQWQPRAVLVSRYGKIVTPVDQKTTSHTDFTMHGLDQSAWVNCPTSWVAKVGGVTEYTDHTEIELTYLDDSAYQFSPEMLYGVTVCFLSGDHRGEIWPVFTDYEILYGDEAEGASGGGQVDLSADTPDLSEVTTDETIRVIGLDTGTAGLEDVFTITDVSDTSDTVATDGVFDGVFTDKQWMITVPGKTDTIIIRTTGLSVAVGDTLSISPVCMTLVGGPLEGVGTRQFRQRRGVNDMSTVLSRVRGTDESALATVPLLRMGVCGSSALFGTEPVATPADSDHLEPADDAALPRFIDLDDATVELTDVPEAGTVPPEDSVGDNYGHLNPSIGTSGVLLYPLILSDVAGITFDLLEFEVEGRIDPTGHDDSEA